MKEMWGQYSEKILINSRSIISKEDYKNPQKEVFYSLSLKKKPVSGKRECPCNLKKFSIEMKQEL